MSELTVAAHEMPPSHSGLNVDPESISIDGIIRACPHLRNRFEQDPEGAKSEAAAGIEVIRHEQQLKEEGKTEEEIDDDFWATLMEENEKDAQNLESAQSEQSKSQDTEPGKTEENPDTELKTINPAEHTVSAIAQAPVNEVSVSVSTESSPDLSPDTVSGEHSQATSNDGSEMNEPAMAAPTETSASQEVSAGDAPESSVTSTAAQEADTGTDATEPTLATPAAPQVREVSQTGEVDTSPVETLPEVEEVLPQPTKDVAVHNTIVNEIIESTHEITAVIQPENTESTEVTSEIPDEPATETLEAELVDDEPEVDALEGLVENPIELPETEIEFLESIEDVAAEPDVLSSESEEIETLTWGDELEKEPEELYDNFVEALETFVSLIEDSDKTTEVFTEELEPSESSDALDTTELSADIPPIVETVSERFAELIEEKKSTVPFVKDIVERMRDISAAETDERIEEAKEELKQRVEALFDELDVEYESDDVDTFMSTILSAEFVTLQGVMELIEEDEEDDTAVITASLSSAASSTDDSGTHDLAHFLGKFAVLGVVVPAR